MDIAEYFANSLKERVTEGVDVDGINTADALNLYQEALNARYNCPDVQERENGKVNAPDECHWDAKEGRQQAVKPVFCHSEGGEAGLPNAVETVCPFWFCNHIFKINLDHIVVEMFGVAVDQVNLFGVRVVHLLLVHLFCHGLVVGLVDVALFPSGNSVEMSLWRAGQPGGRRMARWWEEKFKKKNKRSEVSPAAGQTFRLEIELNASAAVARRTVNSWAPQAF